MNTNTICKTIHSVTVTAPEGMKIEGNNSNIQTVFFETIESADKAALDALHKGYSVIMICGTPLYK